MRYILDYKIIDQLVRFMQLITSENMQLEFAMLIQTMSIVFMSCINSDDDNCLYVTEFMDFFQNYVSMKEENHMGAWMIQIMLELIQDRHYSHFLQMVG
ncbi:hypothetical protein LSH36_2237g00001 [Paralvinella palmiformis]|uniref:Uncharacterized protein n=1 Tax=Paralvinella palmiformis TaxID=53620 RepID=A0AAD9IQ70_9ANNE|nr:hypothetical protein LSH36_2237g00001 [Paralvinella palmiformis]